MSFDGRKSVWRASVGVAALAMSACATPATELALAPIDTPSQWSAVSEQLAEGVAPISQDWLAELNDPQAAQIVGEALLYNNDLAASASRVKAARERARITAGGLFPSITVGADATRARTPGGLQIINGQPVSLGGYSNSTSLGTNLSWEADIWGANLDATRASFQDARASGLGFAAGQLSIAGASAQAFYGLTEARLQRQLSERDVESQESSLRIIERRYTSGVASSLDLRLARSSLASARATLIGRQQAEKESARRLEVLLGRYPGATIDAASSLPQLAPMVSETGTVIGLGTPESLLFRRPDVLAAEATLKAAGLRVSEARKAFLPTLNVFFAADERGTGLEDILDIDSVIAQLVGSLTQPVFQGGRLRANAAAQRHGRDAEIYTYAQTVLTAWREVEDALAAEQYLAAREEEQRLAFEEAIAAEELTNRQYLNGTTNIFNLLNAQQRRIGAESQFIAAQLQRLSNRIDLYLALGAPFEAPVPERADLDKKTPVQVPRNLPSEKGNRS